MLRDQELANSAEVRLEVHRSAHDRAIIDAAELVAMFIGARSPRTRAAYRADLEHFRRHVGAPSATMAAQMLLGSPHGAANALALRYRTALVAGGFAAATINRRLASLRALVALGRALGLVTWKLEIGNLRHRAYRDTSGPGDDGVRKLINAAAMQPDACRAARDVVLIRLLHDLALRRGEVCSLDLSDFDETGGRLMVLGKGYADKEPIALPAATRVALSTWLSHRGRGPGPLVTSLDVARTSRTSARLTGTGLWSIVRRLGRAAGLTTWPHGLRHAAITRALDVTNGDVRKVQRFSRHADVRTVLIYDDARPDRVADVAEMVASIEVAGTGTPHS